MRAYSSHRIPISVKYISVAYPGFPIGGANSKGVDSNLLFGKYFCRKLHEMKKNGQRGAHVPSDFPYPEIHSTKTFAEQ